MNKKEEFAVEANEDVLSKMVTVFKDWQFFKTKKEELKTKILLEEKKVEQLRKELEEADVQVYKHERKIIDTFGSLK